MKEKQDFSTSSSIRSKYIQHGDSW